MVNQQIEYSCGAACGRQLLQDEGVEVSEAALRETCFMPERGVIAEDIATNLNRATGNQPGLSGHFVGGTLPWENLPAEALQQFADSMGQKSFMANTAGHWVIVDRVADGTVSLRDPWGLAGPGSGRG